MRVPLIVSTSLVLVLLAATVAAPALAATDEVALASSPSARAAAVSGAAPVLDAVSNMTVNAGETADQAVHATDADGDPLNFYKSAGPPYMSVTTTDPGSGSATGNIHLEPGLLSGGTSPASVGVSDGSLTTNRSFSITVVGGDTAPVLAQPSDMTLRAGRTQDQTLTATDADGDPLAFSKSFGPAFLTVTTTDPGSGTAYGNAHVAPSGSDLGLFAATVAVGDDLLTDEKSFQIVVLADTAPTLSYVNDMTASAGHTATQTIYGQDADADPLTFSKVIGPTYMTVMTVTPGSGSGTGLIQLDPTISDIGSTTGTVRVSDGALSAQRTFYITVYPPDNPPVLNQPADMTVEAGEVATQTVTATDPDNTYMYISKQSGPSWVTIGSSYGYGTVSALVTAAPGSNDVGTATVTLVAYSNGLTDTKSFTITVVAGNFPPSCGAGSFARLDVSFGSGVIEVQAGDLNEDGIADLLVEMPNGGQAGFALGHGDGSFDALTLLDAGYSPASGAIDDFNGDEHPDIAILDGSADRVVVFLGDGMGGFGAGTSIAVTAARSLVTADINGDGKRDILLADPQYNVARILRGVGNGTFQAPTTVAAGSGAWALTTADLNGDGAPDLIVTNAGANTISVFRNNGSGSLGSRTDYPVGSEPLGVAARDLDGNGTADVVVSNAYSSSVTVYYGTGNGALASPRTFATGGGPRQIAIEDWNGDGHLDLAVANLDSYTVSVLLGSGTGSFGARTDFATGSGPYGIASADWNDDLRPDFAVANYYGGSVSVFLNGCAPAVDHPPVVAAPRQLTGPEGTPISFTVNASDPDGPAIASLTMDASALPLGNDAMLAVGAEPTTGTFSWTPSYQSARAAPYAIVFTATNVIAGSATTKITVLDVNRPPHADPGGPYVGFAGAPISFDGHASSDPDGDPLTYAWIFGDGKSGVGVEVMHTYASIGVYGVALTVSDGVATDLAITTATVQGIFEARAFTDGGNRSIRLSSGKPTWCAELEPVGRSYSNVTVDLGSIVMKSDGTGTVGEIHAIAGKGASTGDSDGNGVAEITACFTKDDLRLLFANLHGKSTVTVTFEGALYTGGIFRARMDVTVSAGGGALAATISPNPLNPDAVLTFRTERDGPVRVAVYDVRGRLVSRLLDQANVPAGYHDVRIAGRREDGAPLASGVYFYRIEAVEGEQTGRFTVLK
ncbi:MAG: FG-GAP-like repeat-containing protein [Hyphomicrobiales bacterium]